MSDKKVKFFWTSLAKPKDGKVKSDTNTIEIKVTPQTHVWRKTESDGSTHNSPFYFRKMTGDFECTVKVTGKTKMLTWLDQCGILVQEKRGIYTKCALEYHQPPGESNVLKYYVASYVHNEDIGLEESITPYPGQWAAGDKNYNYEMLESGQQKDLWLKISRLEGFIEAQYSFDGEDWKDLKAAKFSEAETLSVGVFAASPGADDAGFKAVLSDLKIAEEEYGSDDDDDEGEEGEEEAVEKEGSTPPAEEPTEEEKPAEEPVEEEEKPDEGKPVEEGEPEEAEAEGEMPEAPVENGESEAPVDQEEK